MTVGRIVDFVVAGVQKGGTTALFEYLADEPQVALSRVKETHFFDDDVADWAAPDYQRYHALFADSGARLRGEATPIYLYWPNCLERIRDYNPAMRLIVVLRDPVERAWSHWRMDFARGVEAHPFGWCIREGRRRLFDAEPWGWGRELSYVERGFYGEQIERLFRLFPREQSLILRSEALRADPAATLAVIRGFLDLPNGGTPRPKRAHVAPDIDYGSRLTEEDQTFLRRLYARDQARQEALIGWRFD